MDKTHDWDKIDKAYQNSNLTQKEFCKQQGISYWTFQTHRKHVRAVSQAKPEIVEILPISISSEDSEAVSAISDGSHHPASIIIKSGKFQIDVSVGFDPSLLRDILQVVDSLC